MDVLINCAGGGSYESTLEMAEESWDSMVDLNLKSVFLCSQAAGKVMVRQRSGVIINFATGAAHSPVPGEIHYSSAKAGVVHFTRVLAAEWGRFGIRVNCISPGVVDGGLARRVMGSDFEKYAKRTALGRAAVPEDFVGVCLFLASDAASYI
ncbi:MAG: SDR family NAD(P)-dependent oxidoreductase, partial [Chloroflexi bacterium]|nr:SDR family NAD(P)-dependent oxidoreductase [Chloroflexota bacterium]